MNRRTVFIRNWSRFPIIFLRIVRKSC